MVKGEASLAAFAPKRRKPQKDKGSKSWLTYVILGFFLLTVSGGLSMYIASQKISNSSEKQAADAKKPEPEFEDVKHFEVEHNQIPTIDVESLPFTAEIESVPRPTPAFSDFQHLGQTKDRYSRLKQMTSLSSDDLYEAGQSITDSPRRNKQPVLAYVTPWNSIGYDYAEKFAKKVDIVSPSWFTIRPDGIVHGKHDVAMDWLQSLKASNNDIKIMPRVAIDGFQTGKEMVNVFAEPNSSKTRAQLLKLVSDFGFDGLVIDVFSGIGKNGRHGVITGNLTAQPIMTFHGPTYPSFREYLTMGILFSTVLGSFLKRHGREVIVVVKPDYLEPKDIKIMKASVAAVHVMTYDFPNQSSGFNAPANWIKKSVEPLTGLGMQVFLGINFYGRVYNLGGGTVERAEILPMLQHEGVRLMWNDKAKEHSIEWTPMAEYTARAFFPTPASVAARVALAKKLDVGVGIWELGQAMPAFYDYL